MSLQTQPAAGHGTLRENARVFNGSTRDLWHRAAPRPVRRAFAKGAAGDGWNHWREHLKTRPEPLPLGELLGLPDGSDPLAWAAPKPDGGRLGPDWLGRARRLSKKDRPADAELEREILGWLADTSGRTGGERAALEVLACCHALPWLAGVVSAEPWWAVLDQLFATVADAGALQIEADPLIHQLLTGELALALAYLLPEMSVCRKLRAPARRALSAGVEELLDGEGLPHSRWLGRTPRLLACWTRACAMGRELKGGCFKADAALQYEWLVRQSLRLLRPDGMQALADEGEAGAYLELLEAALRLGGDRNDRKIARLVLPKQKKGRPGKTDGRGRLPEAACHSEWAGVSVLRPDWSRGCPRLAVACDGPAARIELICGRDVLLEGTWDVEVRLDGKAIEPGPGWDEACWESDGDVDYLELEMELGDGLKLQRQIALAREDRFLLLADAVLSRRGGRLEYRTSLPLAQGARFTPAEESREGVLGGKRRRARVMPLALPEWRSLESPGDLAAVDGRLRLEQQGETALFAPLFFDLERDRLSKRFTWRRLTVAEQLEIVPRQVAAGFRVAIGRRQWLIYRAIAGRGNRTVLGHNLATESLIARFGETGEPERLIEIE